MRRKTRTWTKEQRAEMAEIARRRKPWLHNTGPRTAEGKAISSQNAFKSGFYTDDMQELKTTLRAQHAFVKEILKAAGMK